MQNINQKIITLLLALLLLITPLLLSPAANAAEETVFPFVAISWEQYFSGAAANNSTELAFVKEADYLQAEVKSLGSDASSRALNYDIARSDLFSEGDSVLIRIVARAAGESGKMYLTLGKSNTSGEVTKSTPTVDVPTEWTEFYFPLSAGGPCSRLYVRIGQQLQTLQFRDLEVINYGSTELSTLPSGSRSTEVDPTVDYSSFCSKAMATRATITRLSGQSGLYSDYLRAEPSQTGNITQVNLNIDWTKDTVEAGSSVLVRAVLRGGSEDLQKFKIALRNADRNTKEMVSSSGHAVPSTWTEYFFPLALNTYNPYRVSLFFGASDTELSKMQILEVADLEIIDYGDTDISTLPTGCRPLIEPMITQKDFTSALTSGEAITGSASYSFQSTDLDVSDGDLLMFSTVVRGQSASAHIRLTIEFTGSSTAMEYAVPVQDTRINMPITADGTLSLVKIEALDNPIILSEATVENRLTATQEELLVESGMHMLESEYTGYMLSETGVNAGKTADLVCSGSYIYSIGSGSLVITDVTDPNAPSLRGKLSGLGDTRQIALCGSGTDVMVTARGYGAWIIDVSNPDAPRIRSHYDSVEMATGIAVEGDYAYISCRQYGVDVVDLSDLDKPRHICILRTGEVQSCKVVDNILYAGLYSQHRVDMYDVSDPVNSRLLGSADLSGRGDGTAIYKADGKVYLFAATGHHSVKNLSVTEPLSNLNYGQGNGMDIFDVTDPSDPKWLSTCKTDGRFYSPSYDYWSVELSMDEEGTLFAYVSSSYNGAFVYDVSSLTAPRRLAHIAIEIPTTSDNYSTLTNSSRTVAYPFDRSKLNWGAVGALAVKDGTLLLAGLTTDLIPLESEQLFHAPLRQTNTTQITPSGDFYSFDGSGLNGYARYSTDSQIHAVALHGSNVFAAGGTNGILILDRDLKLQKQFATGGTCYDVQIRGDVLYAAEGVAGLAAYSLQETSLTELWRYSASGRAVKQVRLSETGKFAVLHVGSNRGEIVRLTDLTRMVHVTASSQMYHHNVANGVVGGRYMCFWANSSDERWYDFGENDSYDEPVLIRNFKPRCAMNGGIEAVGDLALSMTSTGYVLYDPSKIEDISSGLTIYRPGQYISGKPSEHLGTLITTNRISGAVYIMDASDLTDPELTNSFTVTGHPATAVYGADAVYIPLGNQGIMKFDHAKAEESLKFTPLP